MIPLVEKQEDWHLLRSGVFAYLNAEGALADRIAGLLWRLHRVVRFESESISRSLEDVPGDWHAQQEMFKRPVPEEPTREGVAEMDEMLMARLLPEEETLDRVMRYDLEGAAGVREDAVGVAGDGPALAHRARCWTPAAEQPAVTGAEVMLSGWCGVKVGATKEDGGEGWPGEAFLRRRSKAAGRSG